tara:strand:+ start:666 stop:863 length:198 start_codon:yes stop_codon:yes gene_type:complete
MNDINNLEQNFDENVNEIKILFEKMINELNQKLETSEESEELFEILDSYKSKIQNLTNSEANEEE